MAALQTRYPWPALTDLLRRNDQGGIRTDAEIKTYLHNRTGVADRTISRWIADGGIPDKTADRVATALNTHPVLIWPEWDQHPELLEATA